MVTPDGQAARSRQGGTALPSEVGSVKVKMKLWLYNCASCIFGLLHNYPLAASEKYIRSHAIEDGSNEGATNKIPKEKSRSASGEYEAFVEVEWDDVRALSLFQYGGNLHCNIRNRHAEDTDPVEPTYLPSRIL